VLCINRGSILVGGPEVGGGLGGPVFCTNRISILACGPEDGSLDGLGLDPSSIVKAENPDFTFWNCS
jgi:hypothetical protein